MLFRIVMGIVCVLLSIGALALGVNEGLSHKFKAQGPALVVGILLLFAAFIGAVHQVSQHVTIPMAVVGVPLLVYAFVDIVCEIF